MSEPFTIAKPTATLYQGQPEWDYTLYVALPVEGRTFLLDQSDDSPTAEFTRALDAGLKFRLGKFKTSGIVGTFNGKRVFWLHADLAGIEESDAESLFLKVAGLLDGVQRMSLREWKVTGPKSAESTQIMEWEIAR